MGSKFKEFYCKSQGRNLNIKCLNESNYRRYENDMFCPFCYQVRLSFVLYTTNKKPYLRTSQKSLHSNTCSHKQKQQSYKTYAKYLQYLKSNPKQLKNQLKSTLRYLSNEQHNINDIHKSDNKNTIIDKSNKIRMPKRYKILRKQSLKELEFKQGKSNEPFIFYGKDVKLNFNKTQGGNYLNAIIKANNNQNIRIGIIVGNRNYPVNSYTFYNIAVIGSLICKKNKKGEECFYIKLDDENREYVLYEPIKNHRI